jgi:hypothetical protein
MQIKSQLKKIEKEQARLARQKEKLQAKLKAAKEQDKKLDQLVKGSGYKTARALIVALMNRYDIGKVSAGRKPRAAAKASGAPRRKRTKMTPELRDQIKAAVKQGTSKVAVAKQFDISYQVVTNAAAGKYDK